MTKCRRNSITCRKWLSFWAYRCFFASSKRRNFSFALPFLCNLICGCAWCCRQVGRGIRLPAVHIYRNSLCPTLPLCHRHKNRHIVVPLSANLLPRCGFDSPKRALTKWLASNLSAKQGCCLCGVLSLWGNRGTWGCGGTKAAFDIAMRAWHIRGRQQKQRGCWQTNLVFVLAKRSCPMPNRHIRPFVA